MDFFLSQITYWANNFAPRSWAFCAGQLLAISSNTALFSLLGTAFGGDGRTTFGLPDLRGRVPVGSSDMGTGPGLSHYSRGVKGGSEYVTLSVAEMPVHNHTATTSGLAVSVNLQVNSGQADTHTPAAGQSIAAPYDNNNLAEIAGFNSSTPDVTLAGGSGTVTGSVAIGNTGGNQSHYNLQPYTALNACICTEGLYPSRN